VRAGICGIRPGDALVSRPSALVMWASRYLAAERDGLMIDPEETEMARAAYAHAFDEQMKGTRGLTLLFPDGELTNA